MAAYLRRADRIVVTDRRIFEVSGILTRKVASMPLAKLTDITYRRSLLCRLFVYGELIVETAGQEQSLQHITHLPRPDDVYRTIAWLVTGGLTPRSNAEGVEEFYDDEGEDGHEGAWHGGPPLGERLGRASGHQVTF